MKTIDIAAIVISCISLILSALSFIRTLPHISYRVIDIYEDILGFFHIKIEVANLSHSPNSIMSVDLLQFDKTIPGVQLELTDFCDYTLHRLPHTYLYGGQSVVFEVGFAPGEIDITNDFCLIFHTSQFKHKHKLILTPEDLKLVFRTDIT